MRSGGSASVFTAKMLLAVAAGVVGIALVFSGSVGGVVLGLIVIAAAFGIGNRAKAARAAHLRQADIARRWQWAQGLWPDKRQEKRRRS